MASSKGLGKYETEDELAELLERDEAERRDVLAKPVAWEALAHNSAAELFISKEEVIALAQYDKRGSDKVDLVQKQGELLIRALLVLLTKMHQLDDLKYVVTLLHDIIVTTPDHEASTKACVSLASKATPAHSLPFAPLLAVLQRRGDDAYLVRCCGALLAALLVRLPASLTKTAAPDVLRALIAAVRNTASERVSGAALPQLRTILTSSRYRVLAVQCDAVAALTPHTESSDVEPLRPRQQQRAYEALYCLWLIAFDPTARAALVEATLLAQLCALLRRVKKEKVVRLAVATLRAVHAEARAADLMLAYEAPKALALIAAKNKQEWGDEDLAEDVEALSEALEKHVDALSSFDRYAFELAAGQLEWSPVHKSERFWQENALKFELQDGQALKTLKALLSSPQSTPTTLAVAAWDVGEFARFHPRGKQIVSALELKLPIMKLLNHPDEAVSREALLALQKMLVTNWEYLAQK